MRTALIVVTDREDATRLDALLSCGRENVFPPLRTIHLDPDTQTIPGQDVALAILDDRLSAPDRFHLAARIREEPRTHDVPIVLLEWRGPDATAPPHLGMASQARVPGPVEPGPLGECCRQAIVWRDRLAASRLRYDLELYFHSVPSLMHDAVDFLTGLLRQTRLRSEQIRQLRHVLIEMGQNAIEWGHRYHVESLVRMSYREHADRVEIVIRDQGSGFDPGRIPHAADHGDPVRHLEVREQLGLREGGFGLMICRGLVDELRYNASGNEVTLLKRFAVEAEDAG